MLMLPPLRVASFVAQIENLREQDGILFYTFRQWYATLRMTLLVAFRLPGDLNYLIPLFDNLLE